jgi:Astacin (Peptidase family M12A)
MTFINKGDNCLANIGRDEGENEVKLPNDLHDQNCFDIGLILHEIMHNLGMDHMQLSPERDDFIIIDWDNIKPSELDLFKKSPENMTSFGLGYDFASVMHYRSRSSSIDKTKPTMTARSGPEDTAKMGNRGKLSEGDIARLRTMYNCDGDRPEEAFSGIEEETQEQEVTDTQWSRGGIF